MNVEEILSLEEERDGICKFRDALCAVLIEGNGSSEIDLAVKTRLLRFLAEAPSGLCSQQILDRGAIFWDMTAAAIQSKSHHTFDFLMAHYVPMSESLIHNFHDISIDYDNDHALEYLITNKSWSLKWTGGFTDWESKIWAAAAHECYRLIERVSPCFLYHKSEEEDLPTYLLGALARTSYNEGFVNLSEEDHRKRISVFLSTVDWVPDLKQKSASVLIEEFLFYMSDAEQSTKEKIRSLSNHPPRQILYWVFEEVANALDVEAWDEKLPSIAESFSANQIGRADGLADMTNEFLLKRQRIRLSKEFEKMPATKLRNKVL